MKKQLLLSACTILAGTLLPQISIAATDSNDPEILIHEGEFFGQIRTRYEHVQQDNALNDATGVTTRINFGYKTGVYNGFQGLFEGQIVQQFDRSFNDTVDGPSGFSVIADPEAEEINQLWVSYSGLPDTNVKVGRQKMNLDNQRFVGTVDWRQNDQTFDSITITNSSIPNLDLLYSYTGNVNRIFGDDAALGDLDSRNHIIHASYKVADWLKITGYGYLFDFEEAPALSTETYGVRLTGKAPINENWSFFYEAEAATQSDYKDNTASYDEEYYHFSPGVKGHGFTAQVGYELLGGDGTDSFITPLATLHKFNGWADVFLNTPDVGLEDIYGKLAYKVKDVHPWVDNVKMAAIYHEFDGDESGDLGSELDLVVSKTFKVPEPLPFDSIGTLIKYADYNADDATSGTSSFVDEEVFWFQVDLKF